MRAGGNRVGWVAYEAIYAAWQGEMGGNQPEGAYRRFVEAGLARKPEDPFREAAGGWLLGDPEVRQRAARIGMTMPRHPDAVPPRFAWRVTITGRFWGPWWSTMGSPKMLLAAAQRRGEPGSGCLTGGSVDASDAPGATRGFRADPSGQHAQPDTTRVDRTLLGSRLLRDEIEAIRQRLRKTENRP